MKKYKLCNQCELSKNIISARGLNEKFSWKLLVGSFATIFGVYGIEFLADIKDNIVSDTILDIACIAIFYCNFMIIYDIKNKEKSIDKLEKLSKKLMEKEIYIDFNRDYVKTECNFDENDFYNSLIVIKDGKQIENFNNEKFLYVDSEKKVDITDEVNRSLLSKRKYKKYIKSKENDNESKIK